MASIMTSCSAAPAALRRALPFSDWSTGSFTGGRIEIVTLGNHDALDLAVLEIAEMRALRAFDANGHDDRIGLVGDHRGAVIDLHQRAGDGDASFGEDHDRLAGRDQLDQVARGQRLGRIDGVVLDHPQERLRPPGLRDAGIDREARIDRQGSRAAAGRRSG